MWKRDINGIEEKQNKETKRIYQQIGTNVFDFFTEKVIQMGFQEREGQWDMSTQIVDAMKNQKHLVIEAGVGIGKSFAYIVPILYYHKKFKKLVIIATSTIALQEQLNNDIRTIMKILDYEIEILIAKGQAHFLCLKRLDEVYHGLETGKNSELVKMLDIIYKGGKEKADWDIEIPDAIWRKINVINYNPNTCKDTCVNYKECYYYQLRQKMQTSTGIVVCNQDLLAVNMEKIFQERNPIINNDFGLIVVDEAHNLENRVRSSVTESWSCKEIQNVLSEVSKAIRYIDNGTTKNIMRANILVEKLFKLFLNQIKKQEKNAREKGQDIERFYVYPVDNIIDDLIDTLGDIQLKAEMGFGDYAGGRRGKNYDDQIERLEDIVGFLRSFAHKKNDIFWLEKKKESAKLNGINLFRCPKNVDQITKNILFENGRAPVVLTSATITSGNERNYEDNYSYFIKNTGFPKELGMICEPKESPFDYNKNAMIYYTENFPHPTKNREEFIDKGVEEILRLLNISNGKALILFTAKTDMIEVYNRLKMENLPYKIYMQLGNAKQAETLDKFKNDVNSVLLGTGSFWEGINIEGIALSHVIVFKLPFPIKEPIIDYKCEQCSDGLMEVLVPEMIIKLKQGIGRLIRSEEDKGIVSIIDSRVGEKSKAPYRDLIWDSLPIKNKTNDINTIRRFYSSVVDTLERQ